MSLKPWREIAVPHEDVLKGTFQQARRYINELIKPLLVE
jgi:hypothetical protein